MENEEETPPLILSDWVEIQSAFSSDESHHGYENENENPVVINEYFFVNDSAVFPPSHHEDLPIDSLNQAEEEEEQQSRALLLPSSSGVEKEAGKWISRDALTPRFFSSVIGKFFSGMSKKCGAFRASVWWFGTATTGVGALALVVVLCRRAKRWRRKKVLPPAADTNQHLMLLIQSKDQKISQLLLQVSQLNDMLLARRRVPVLQVG
ncbi:OLC1v1032713C1 [Oldenlandia corymbosa var. corymbosa]|uniref:OLC1v1032713C1 n=1 Tax=Oldenlandia corymbosa var. corymbosa TaxID=529605 RepID=A0AAV1CPT1_OLDCO|nr:OLC1v1032713C1 [Oldenlandia corymbosa var. corymbosa]